MRRRTAALVAFMAAALVFGATNSVAGQTASGAKVIKVALIEDLTGTFAPLSGPQPSQAFINDLNAHGGLNGYKVVTSVYDGQSNTAATLQAARRAVQSHPVAVLMGAWNPTSANAFLAKTGLPVVGFAGTGGFSGYNNVFSDIGEAAEQGSDIWLRILALRGAHKVALLDTSYAATLDALMKKLAPGVGAKIVYDNVTLPYPVDSPTALSLAEDVKSSGATGVWAAAGGDLVQADLNQLGYKASVLEDSASGPSVIKQWGSKVNGMIFGSLTATAYVKHNAAVTKFIALMKKYGYSKYTYNDPYAIEHYAATMMLFHGMAAGGDPTNPKATVNALNKLHRYTAGGILPFVSFPAFHTIAADCATTTTVVNGQWVSDKNGSNPFVCSKSGSRKLQ